MFLFLFFCKGDPKIFVSYSGKKINTNIFGFLFSQKYQTEFVFVLGPENCTDSECRYDFLSCFQALTLIVMKNCYSFIWCYVSVFHMWIPLLKIHWGYTLAEVRPRPRKRCNNYFTKTFFSKFLILSTGLPRRRSPPKNAARWRCRLPIENLTAHYDSQFCVSFYFFCQEAQKRLWTIILFISQMRAGFFLYTTGLVITRWMLKKYIIVTPTLQRSRN